MVSFVFENTATESWRRSLCDHWGGCCDLDKRRQPLSSGWFWQRKSQPGWRSTQVKFIGSDNWQNVGVACDNEDATGPVSRCREMLLIEEGSDLVVQRGRQQCLLLVLNFCLRCFDTQNGHPESSVQVVLCAIMWVELDEVDWEAWGKNSERAKNKQCLMTEQGQMCQQGLPMPETLLDT